MNKKDIIAKLKKFAEEQGIDLTDSIATSQGNESKEETPAVEAPVEKPAEKPTEVTAETAPEVKEEEKVEEEDFPDLTKYEPAGWSDALVITKEPGTFKDSTDIKSSDKLFVSFAVANLGYVPSKKFEVVFYLDGEVHTTFDIDSLKAGKYRYIEDEAIGTLSSGVHEFKMVIDENSRVKEKTKGNNAYLKSIVVGGDGEVKESKIASVDFDNEIKDVKEEIKTDDKATEKSDAVNNVKDEIRTDDKTTEKADAVETAKGNNKVANDDSLNVGQQDALQALSNKETEKVANNDSLNPSQQDALQALSDKEDKTEKVANNDSLNPGQEDVLQEMFDEEHKGEDKSLKVAASKDLIVLAKKISTFKNPLTAKQQNAIAKACLVIAEKLGK